MTKWINKEQKLPPQNKCVLVNIFNGRDKVKMHFICIAYRMGNDWFYSDNGDVIKTLVTHWQPLPDTVDIESKVIDE